MKVPFGLHEKTNRYIGIDQAKNGLSCGCICPSCKMHLKARQGEENEHHFAHHKKAEVECEYSYWVAVRSMAKQIIKEKGIVSDSEKIKVFAVIPWTNKAPLTTKKIILNPHIKEYQFDAKINSSLGVYYIYFMTNTVEDSGRVRSHYANQPTGNTFSQYLVLEVDFNKVKQHNNKANKYLETLLLKQSRNEKKWFSSHSSHSEYLENMRLQKEQQIEIEKRREEAKNSPMIQDRIIIPLSNISKIKRTQNTGVSRLAGFYKYMHDSYSYKEKLSENLTIVYKGKNLWYVSCCHEFFCVSGERTYTVYKVAGNNIIPLASSESFDDLDYCLKRYVVERDCVL